jgi:nucleoside-diphosphate-sugar epimerase
VRVRVLDNFSSGLASNLRAFAGKVEVLRGDIRSPQACRRATKGVSFVFHQAALRSVPKSMVNPAEYNDVNIQGTLNMLQASRDNGVRSFVFASSSSVYGETNSFPERETDAPLLISPYALSKLTGEYYCKIFSFHYKIACVSLRYFNVFGPRQSLDDEYAVVVPKFINCMLDGKQPPVFGTGKQSRDFTYVQNVVQANILAAQRAGRLRGKVFNVASGRDYQVLELVRILNELLGTSIKPQLLPKRAGDVFRTLADLSGARRLLGFAPAVDFKQGLKHTLEYWKCRRG